MVRIKVLAELAGTTVRTIRFYHQIGLLPVPRHCGGRCDYDLTHVARLARIRWLAQAGIPLSRVAEMVVSGPVAAGQARTTRNGTRRAEACAAATLSTGVESADPSIPATTGAVAVTVPRTTTTGHCAWAVTAQLT